jgi:hypothetical protein
MYIGMPVNMNLNSFNSISPISIKKGVSVCLLIIHFHSAALILTEFGMMVEDLHGVIPGYLQNSQKMFCLFFLTY